MLHVLSLELCLYDTYMFSNRPLTQAYLHVVPSSSANMLYVLLTSSTNMLHVLYRALPLCYMFSEGALPLCYMLSHRTLPISYIFSHWRSSNRIPVIPWSSANMPHMIPWSSTHGIFELSHSRYATSSPMGAMLISYRFYNRSYANSHCIRYTLCRSTNRPNVHKPELCQYSSNYFCM